MCLVLIRLSCKLRFKPMRNWPRSIKRKLSRRIIVSMSSNRNLRKMPHTMQMTSQLDSIMVSRSLPLMLKGILRKDLKSRKVKRDHPKSTKIMSLISTSTNLSRNSSKYSHSNNLLRIKVEVAEISLIS